MTSTAGTHLTTSPRCSRHLALAAIALLVSAFGLSGSFLGVTVARAATPDIAQCNDVGPGPMGATTSMTCRVSVVNTIDHGHTGSTTTLSRQCTLGPCAPGNGTFTTHSTQLVTRIAQCNGSDNDSAHRIVCDVSVVNNISGDTPQATPLTPATVNQCVGSGQGGGGSTTGCRPTPANTTTATITQCNGSGNGGGGTVSCTVDARSTVSRAIAIRINQCNGSGNPGGSTVTCSARISTNVTANAVGTGPAGTRPASTGPASTAPLGPSGPQVTRRPVGGVQTGGGSTAGLEHRGPLVLGVTLLLAAGLLQNRAARRRQR